jgi:hypothetical protein
LTGSIPETLQLPSIFYFDVGFNLLTGGLPETFPTTATELRHLHLDNNQLNGILPYSYVNAGNQGLLALTVDNNQLTGAVPAGGSTAMGKLFIFRFYRFLQKLFMDNSHFHSMPTQSNTCYKTTTLLKTWTTVPVNWMSYWSKQDHAWSSRPTAAFANATKVDSFALVATFDE